ncbi:hypothetical protein BM523_16260 [Alteromonas mediterranea]|uniref:hypothetical protein n=1 Tax=Alteromonas mediterranea TaxID=314275 RepID=UPI0009044607|nr:hypothetical protein [Alteromonas mediterranea]APD95421.1 hypothetical protein BM523_16260 [Alteromonas mediterranea]APD99055.1 hypothetical protein BM525_16280 [Alteromonas mediterranea]
MKYNKQLLITSLAAAIAGCGGGSSSQPPTNDNGSTPPTSNFEYVVSANYFSSCGEITPQTEAMVVRHDNSGAVAAVYEADDDGNIAIDYAGVATYTMLSVGYWGETAYPRVHTYVDITADKIKNTRIIAEGFANEDSCECNNITFDISNVPVALPMASVVVSTTTSADIFDINDTDGLAEAYVCRSIGGDWPDIALTLTSAQEEPAKTYYTAVLSGYSFDETFVVSNAELVRKVPFSVLNNNVNSDSSLRVSLRGRKDDWLHYADNVRVWDVAELSPSVPIFDTPETYIDAYNVEFDSFSSEGTDIQVSIYTGAEVTVPSTHTESLDLSLMSYDLFSQQVSTFFDDESYDLSALGADSVTVTMSGNDSFDDRLYFFQLTTPSEGSLAILDSLEIEGVDFPLSSNFNFDEEPASGYISLEAYDVQSTTDYLESLNSDDVTAYGIVYFDF